MGRHTEHNKEVVSQFARQAIPFAQLSGHLESLDLLVNMSGVNNDSHVLDVAAGPGLVALMFAKVARLVECLDLTPAMIEQAKRRAAVDKMVNISFREGNAMALPYANNSFDVVVTRYSFHHFLEPVKVLAEMVRVCKHGGCVIVADVAVEPACAEKYNTIEHLRDSSHVRALSSAEFEGMFLQDVFSRCEKAKYSVEVELEAQLSASFPKAGDDAKIREMITADIGHNITGLNPCLRNGKVYYSYPISVYAAIKQR